MPITVVIRPLFSAGVWGFPCLIAAIEFSRKRGSISLLAGHSRIFSLADFSLADLQVMFFLNPSSPCSISGISIIGLSRRRHYDDI